MIGLSSRFVGKGDLFSCRRGVVPVLCVACCAWARNEHACRQSLLGLLGSIKEKIRLSFLMACMFDFFFVDLARQNTPTKKKHYA